VKEAIACKLNLMVDRTSTALKIAADVETARTFHCPGREVAATTVTGHLAGNVR
jgi:hypothetical protein